MDMGIVLVEGCIGIADPAIGAVFHERLYEIDAKFDPAAASN
jgi:hypothetical protein